MKQPSPKSRQEDYLLNQQDRQQRHRLEVLLEIHRAILATQDLQATSSAALRQIQQIFPQAIASSVVLIDPIHGQPRIAAIRVYEQDVPFDGMDPLLPGDLAVDLDLLGSGKPYIVENLNALGQPLLLQQKMIAAGIQSYISIPLRAAGVLIGMLNLGAASVAAFGSQDLRIAQELADSLAVAIQQARLIEGEQQRRQEAEIMRDVMAALASSVELNQVLAVILKNLGKVVRFDRAALYMLDENARYQTLLISREHPAIFSMDDPVVAELRRTRQILVIPDVQKDERFQAWPEIELVRGWMGAPLVAGDEMVGIVSLGSLEAGVYSEAEAGVVQIFTSQAAEVVQRVRLQEQSARRAEELELLTSFSLALRQVEGQENILAAVMEQTGRIFGASEGTFLLLEKDESALFVTFSQKAALRDSWYTSGEDLFWQTVRTSKPFFIPDLADIPDLNDHLIYQEIFKDIRSAVLLPLSAPGRSFGVLCFTFTEAQEFSKEDQKNFVAISEIAGTALHRAAVLESLERQVTTRTRYLSTLYEISAVAGEPVELEILLERMLGLTLEVMDSKTGALHLIDSQQKNLVLTIQKGISIDYLQAIANLPLEDAFWQRIVSSNEPMVIPDLLNDSRAPAVLKAGPYAAYLAAPVRVKRQAIGLLSLFGDSILDYTIEDITLFTTIAEQLGSAIERSRLQKQAEQAAVAEERQRLARDLHDSVSQLLYSLVLYAGAGRKVLKQGELGFAEDYLEKIDQTSQQALREMRLLVYELRPSVFREEGLIGALNRRVQAVEKRTGMNAQILVNGHPDLDDATELALYRIAEEALNNTLKHSKAQSVLVQLDFSPGHLDLKIEDDGCGFDLQHGLSSGGLGLLGIRERVHQLGGKLQIFSMPGKGTRIDIHLEVPK